MIRTPGILFSGDVGKDNIDALMKDLSGDLRELLGISKKRILSVRVILREKKVVDIVLEEKSVLRVTDFMAPTLGQAG